MQGIKNISIKFATICVIISGRFFFSQRFVIYVPNIVMKLTFHGIVKLSE
jgi:hypothetical protein